eukprot:NODE_3903_length_623_cov_249.374564_g2811_i0.p1 GENE.NODE_3903_length_623_cov_249.374564_g2811_i0~~NODE_3903_length_623_cov_249.374564_g2811_i0.p1  ORF type:complete len:102 (+),score=9.50 NODE_3903_length_623_cov_249.374564_g2811_i0:54-359(+)
MSLPLSISDFLTDKEGKAVLEDAACRNMWTSGNVFLRPSKMDFFGQRCKRLTNKCQRSSYQQPDKAEPFRCPECDLLSLKVRYVADKYPGVACQCHRDSGD